MLNQALLLAQTPLLRRLGESSLLLLVGGMSVLVLLLVVSVLQRLARPPRVAASEEPPPTRQLRPIHPDVAVAGEFEPVVDGRPRRALLPLDAVLARVIDLQLGEPRILRTVGRHSRIRLYRCAGCQRAATDPAAGCRFEGAGLEEAFRTRYRPPILVRESACRLTGAPHCEFEVRH